jgi:hypothetical protein
MTWLARLRQGSVACHNVHSGRSLTQAAGARSLRQWSGEDRFDSSVALNSASQGFIARQESRTETFGQGHVRGVVRREVGSQAQDTAQQGPVARTTQGQVEVVVESLFGPVLADVPPKQESAKGRGDLHIAERRDVERLPRRADDVASTRRSVRDE